MTVCRRLGCHRAIAANGAPRPPQLQEVPPMAAQAAAEPPPVASAESALAQAAAQAETEPPPVASAESALPLLLQNDSICTRVVLCKLLCCSRALAAAVTEHCAGRLDVACCAWRPAAAAIREQRTVPWLRKHARLARSLDLQSWTQHVNDGEYGPAASPVIRGCVSAVLAAGPSTLTALRSLKLDISPAVPTILQQLPASFLTELDLCSRLHDFDREDELDAAEQQQQQQREGAPGRLPACHAACAAVAALGRLTALRRLRLQQPMHTLAPLQGLSGMAALSQLTALGLQGAAAELQHVPRQLLELDLRIDHENDWDDDPPPLNLRHLGAVTALTIAHLHEGDLLPPRLLNLQVDCCRCSDGQPLLAVKDGLQQLRLTLAPGEDIPPGQLQQLSRLTALSLQYAAHYRMPKPANAAAWPLLPLQRLELQNANLSAGLCQHVAACSGLTLLQLRGLQLPDAASVRQLAAAIQQLSGLQQLTLSPGCGLDAAAGTEQHADPGKARQLLLQAVCGLQQLRGLDISWFGQLADAAPDISGGFAALTALTALSLAHAGMSGAAASAILSSLPEGMQSLSCGYAGGITDAVLPCIGRLQELTRLSLFGLSGVSDAGLRQLSSLTRLQQLDVLGTRVTREGLLASVSRLHTLNATGLQRMSMGALTC